MSELSSEKPTAAGRVVQPDTADENAGQDRLRVRRIQIWATAGGLLLAVQVYVWARWITGPFFQRVPGGPISPPMYMRAFLTMNAVLMCVALPVAIWWFLIRPWLRERRITLDGILLVSMGLMFFQDPLLNYFNTWCTYNTWLFNRGSWSSDIPGWVSPEQPGHQVSEPLLINAPGYAAGVLVITILGCWVMRGMKSRRPNITNLRLILLTYAFTFVLDFVMEACFMLPFGLYTYPGAIRSVSFGAGTYHQWPVYEGLMWGAVQAGLCCLRYFTDDRGRTVVERGLERVGGGFARQQLARFLAVFAAVSACFFFFYNVPAQWVGMHADPWPADHLKRSYFNGGICGTGTGTPCPDPVLPVPTKRSGYIDTNGRLILPDGARVPDNVPFEHVR